MEGFRSTKYKIRINPLVYFFVKSPTGKSGYGKPTGRPDGSVRVGRSSDGREIKVHRDTKRKIHGYPVP